MRLSKIMGMITSTSYLDFSSGRECIDQWIHSNLFTSYISHCQLMSLLGTWLVGIGPSQHWVHLKFKVVELGANS